MTRAIIHIDMDAFFAAIEQRDHAAYRHQPVIVGGSKDSRGVVSTASYEARQFGIHSAMAMSEALRRCPNGIYLPVDMAKYRGVSAQIMAIFHRYTPLVEAISLDEAFLDVTESRLLFGEAADIAHAIKREIKAEVHLTASVGIAHCKFLAKLASEMNKPDGFYQINADELPQKVWPLAIQKMMGVGKKTEALLLKMGIRTIGQLAKCDRNILSQILGKQGLLLHDLANGVDQRPVEAERAAKSIGRETTFAQDIDDQYILETILMDLTEDVTATLRRRRLKGRTVQIKIRYDDFKSVTRAMTIADYTANFALIFSIAEQLFRDHYSVNRPVRLLGVSVSHLAADEEIVSQMQLFNLNKPKEKQEKLDTVLDHLNERYGKKTVTRARQMTNELPQKE